MFKKFRISVFGREVEMDWIDVGAIVFPLVVFGYIYLRQPENFAYAFSDFLTSLAFLYSFYFLIKNLMNEAKNRLDPIQLGFFGLGSMGLIHFAMVLRFRLSGLSLWGLISIFLIIDIVIFLRTKKRKK